MNNVSMTKATRGHRIGAPSRQPDPTAGIARPPARGARATPPALPAPEPQRPRPVVDSRRRGFQKPAARREARAEGGAEGFLGGGWPRLPMPRRGGGRWIRAAAVGALLAAAAALAMAPGGAEAGRRDPYAVLGVPRGASQAEIKKAYRRLSLQYHPDKNRAEDAKERFVEVAGAYEILGDEKKRRQYDAGGFSAAGGDGPGSNPFEGAGGDWDDLSPEQQEEIMRQASAMFDEVLEQVEEMLSDYDKMWDLVNGAFGEADVKKQGWGEWIAKGAIARIGYRLGNFMQGQIEAGNVQMSVNGIDMGSQDFLDAKDRRRGRKAKEKLRPGHEFR